MTSASVRDLDERLVMYLSWLSMSETFFFIFLLRFFVLLGFGVLLGLRV